MINMVSKIIDRVSLVMSEEKVIRSSRYFKNTRLHYGIRIHHLIIQEPTLTI